MRPRRVRVRLQDAIECLSGSLRRRPAKSEKQVWIVRVLGERVLQAGNVLRRPAGVVRGGAAPARQVGVEVGKLIRSEEQVWIVRVLGERVLQAGNVLRRPAGVVRGGAAPARQVGVEFGKLIEAPFRS